MPAKKKTALAKVTKKPELTVAARKEVWAGAGKLAGVRTPEDQKNEALITMVALAFAVPPIGVNILGGKPYLNKEALLYKLHEYSDREKAGAGRLKGIKKEFIQYSLKPSDPSVLKATLEFDDGTYVEGIGEASQDNVSLPAVKKSLNMMAETRAVNRAIRQHISMKLWSEAMDRIAKQGSDAATRALIENAATVSAEEMDQPTAKQKVEQAQATPENDLASTIMRAVSAAKSKATLEQIRGKVELSDKVSEGGKKMLLTMIDQKAKEL